MSEADSSLVDQVSQNILNNFNSIHVIPNDGPMFVDLLEGVSL